MDQYPLFPFRVPCSQLQEIHTLQQLVAPLHLSCKSHRPDNLEVAVVSQGRI